MSYQITLPPEAILARFELISDISIDLLQAYEKRFCDSDLVKCNSRKVLDPYFENLIELIFELQKLKSTNFFKFNVEIRFKISLGIRTLGRLIAESGVEWKEENFYIGVMSDVFDEI